jgi:murein DD-endopeptidase MepM/ murein hydrolase activator NlpD
VALNLAAPAVRSIEQRSIFLQVGALDTFCGGRVPSKAMSSEAGKHVVTRASRALLRCCSFRNVFALTAGTVIGLVPLISVGPAASSIAMLPYAPQYPHQAYGYELALTRLQRNKPAADWLAAADRALLAPRTIELPFRGAGEQAAEPTAMGYSFKVPVGRRVFVKVAGDGVGSGELFVDLFSASAAKRERIAGALPGDVSSPIVLDVVEGGEYLVRVQPPLGGATSFSVEIETQPLLAFPVAGVDSRAIWSAFGAERDGGRRSHRGVDIFAARGTPVLAATDGWVTRVETTRVGGNVVWMQPLFGNMRVYYAHLHEQWVKPGQFVLAGHPLGSVGNTGNAVTTPPHLHFGVYARRAGARGGAQDPAEFLR